MTAAPGAPPVVTAPGDLVAYARRLAEPGGPRRILGLAGAPGAGKSTLAAYLARELGPERAVLVPMDGFHLADAELQRLGRAARKGAPDTFDAAGCAALLRRLREPREGETVYAPGFDRTLDQPIAGTIPVPPEIPLVITEGNYLFLDHPDHPAWRPVTALLDARWWVALDDAVRLGRLIARHERYGKPHADAARWAHGSDETNAHLVAPGRETADLVAELPPEERLA